MKQSAKTLSLLLFLVFILYATDTSAQIEESDLRIFGYFQNEFRYESELENKESDITSFGLQQLNIFLQKDLAPRWSSFVNFEVLNTYSSNRQWGAFNLEEAWARYRMSKEFSLKLGLLIPVFNNLNEIKNRTPLLPYIIRPLIYESSFNEIIDLENLLPARAFVQAYGFVPYKEAKFDYAAYVGNSPNVRTTREEGQSGIDSTTTVLIGGRIGARYRNWKAGLSATRDQVNAFKEAQLYLGGPLTRFEERPRLRLGGDLSYDDGRLIAEGEYLRVSYDDGAPEIRLGDDFYYGTLGYYVSERLFVFGSYWYIKVHFTEGLELEPEPTIAKGVFDVAVPNAGLWYQTNDRVALKAHYARGEIDSDIPIVPEREFDFYTAAISVFF